MGGNTYGRFFRITTWGESHGKALGVVIDGCPPGIKISEDEINKELNLRKPKTDELSTSRKEDDRCEILSGVFEGKTLGTPISIIVNNKDVDSSSYEKIKGVFRPGHADYTYFKKYGLYDHRGGGRASGRETVARVAAGAVARKVLEKEIKGFELFSFTKNTSDFLSEKTGTAVLRPPAGNPDPAVWHPHGDDRVLPLPAPARALPVRACSLDHVHLVRLLPVVQRSPGSDGA